MQSVPRYHLDGDLMSLLNCKEMNYEQGLEIENEIRAIFII